MKTKAPRKKRGFRSSRNLRQVNYHVGLMKDLTLYFSSCAFTNPFITTNSRLEKRLHQGILNLVVDTDPERTLCETTVTPVPFDRLGLGRGPIWPAEKWSRIVKSSPSWPQQVREAAEPLLVSKKATPGWKEIEAFIDNIGLKALPILGYVGGRIYMDILARRQVPICTFWVKRYKVAPAGIVAPDASHDIGHGLAMASEDYRELCIEFCKASLKWPGYLNSSRIYDDYVQFFELAFHADERGRVDPIGADTFGMDAFALVGGQIKTKSGKSDAESPYYFSSREAWQKAASDFINKIYKRRLQKVSLQPSGRVIM